MSWRTSPETLRESIDEFLILGDPNNISFYKKQRLSDSISNGKKSKLSFINHHIRVEMEHLY